MIGPGTIGIYGHSQDFFLATGKQTESSKYMKWAITPLLTSLSWLVRGKHSCFSVLAFLTLCIILLNTFWGVIFFTSLDKGGIHRLLGPGIVLGTHMLFSCIVSPRLRCVSWDGRVVLDIVQSNKHANVLDIPCCRLRAVGGHDHLHVILTWI